MADNSQSSSIRRLSTKERRGAEDDLAQWMSPAEMEEKFEELADILGGNLFIQSGLQFLREAYTAAKFGKLHCARRVRICPSDRPDIELDYGNANLRQFEVTEADLPGRLRGAEYGKSMGQPSQITSISHQEMIENAKAIPGALKIASEKKAVKMAAGEYEPSCGLVVLLNITTFGVGRAGVVASMKDATKSAGDTFRDVFVLWNGELFSVWP